jgi:hypothetical protein
VVHPLGCHRSRIPDRIVFDKLVQVLVFGCAYHRIADEACSATTLRRRVEWIVAAPANRPDAPLLEPTLDVRCCAIGKQLIDIVVTELVGL